MSILHWAFVAVAIFLYFCAVEFVFNMGGRSNNPDRFYEDSEEYNRDYTIGLFLTLGVISSIIAVALT